MRSPKNRSSESEIEQLADRVDVETEHVLAARRKLADTAGRVDEIAEALREAGERLARLAETAEEVSRGGASGTVERWAADALMNRSRDLAEAARMMAAEARADWRAELVESLEDADEIKLRREAGLAPAPLPDDDELAAYALTRALKVERLAPESRRKVMQYAWACVAVLRLIVADEHAHQPAR